MSMLLLSLLLLLLAAGRARAAYCSIVDTGVLQGEVGVHMETLRPGQRALRLAVPPVCAEQNGMRAVACETATLSAVEAIDAVEAADSDAADAAERAAAPRVLLAGRSVAVTRSAAAAPDGFAVLSIEVYCNIPLDETTDI